MSFNKIWHTIVRFRHQYSYETFLNYRYKYCKRLSWIFSSLSFKLPYRKTNWKFLTKLSRSWPHKITPLFTIIDLCDRLDLTVFISVRYWTAARYFVFWLSLVKFFPKVLVYCIVVVFLPLWWIKMKNEYIAVSVSRCASWRAIQRRNNVYCCDAMRCV